MNISLNNISFKYPEGAHVFENNTIELTTSSSHDHNMYGIIGPSGTGKTTLVSILGGQLKPDTGTVSINGTDIYSITDKDRRRLIAIQMQTSTALRGNVRYNLTFGLPVNNIQHEELFGDLEGGEKFCTINDRELIDVLEKVGLWHLFKEKKGLDTLIGENGLTLSGGQKQRLNFANLYLRAKHYKPTVILIDEPTSSLDEISEKAITDLIFELSEQSLVLVVAHRIKTLDHANALFDSSLVSPNTSIDFLTTDELKPQSKYYSALISGEISLDLD